MKIFITGVAGFIGYHLAKKYIHLGHEVYGIDNLNDYYDIKLKQQRLKDIQSSSASGSSASGSFASGSFAFKKLDCYENQELIKLFKQVKPDIVVHLAAQAGVRYSITHPFGYISSNITGHLSVVEAIVKTDPKIILLYASSSSVYGENNKVPYQENDPVNNPCSLYAMSKRASEQISQTYHHLYGLKQTGLRFFTVYGDYGRPDMAYWIFTQKLLNNQPVVLFEKGKLQRDFTHVSDIVSAVVKLSEKQFHEKEKSFHKIFNIGNNNPVTVNEFYDIIAKATGIKGKVEYVAIQAGDVRQTYADIGLLNSEIGFKPSMNLEKGLQSFVKWYKEYHNIL